MEAECFPGDLEQSGWGYHHKHIGVWWLVNGDRCCSLAGIEVFESTDKDCEVQRIPQTEWISQVTQPCYKEVRRDMQQSQESDYPTGETSFAKAASQRHVWSVVICEYAIIMAKLRQ